MDLTTLLDCCDFERWLVVMKKPEGDPTRDEIIDKYIKTLAQVVGSEEEARRKIYSVSTTCYYAFGCLVSEEHCYKLKELPGVRWVLPDSYLDVKNKDYGVCDSAEIQTSLLIQVQDNFESPETISRKDQIERQRRMKIGLANKGKVPWNKGKKHSAETRVRIKQRTIEALRDPKVRKKMAGSRGHSDEVKAKIGSSLRRLWDERLKLKRLKEKFILSWAESIANAAKDGGNCEAELDWDSYDKLKQEIALQQLQQAAEKEKAKEIAKIRARQAAQRKAEKLARLEEERKIREERMKARREMRKNISRKSIEEKKLRQRLTKIHRKKSLNGRVYNQTETLIPNSSVWEKLDMELVKKEKMQKNVSLADEIRAAKGKKSDPATGKILVSSFSSSSSCERQYLSPVIQRE